MTDFMRSQESRQIRLKLARTIAHHEPGLSKEALNARIKDIYGVGLRHSVILDIKHEARMERPAPEQPTRPTYQPPKERAPIEERPPRPTAEAPRPVISRADRFIKTQDIIRKNPELNKEAISSQLKELTGKGLRHSEILRVKREVFKESPKIMPEKNLTRRYIKHIFGNQPEARFEKLVNSKIWTRQEALSLSQLPLSRITYLENMAKERQSLIAQVKILKKENGWSGKEYKQHLADDIEAEYLTHGWTNKKNEGEIFRMVDDFRQAMIAEGKDPSPDKGRKLFRNPDGSLRILRDKGNTAGQKDRYRSLHSDVIKQQRISYRARVAARGGRIVHGRTIFQH